MQRLLLPNDIPRSLWNEGQSCLILPKNLVQAWLKRLTSEDLLDTAKDITISNETGGISKEETNKHFATRFTGSCARATYSLIDPENKLGELSNALTSLLAGGKLFICDIPCGAGAASASLLTTIAQLRRKKKLPRIPLDVVVVGGEISEVARNHANALLSELKRKLADQAIFLSFTIKSWNAKCPIENSDFIKHVTLQSQMTTNKLLIVSNFSGFARSTENQKKSKSQFDELFRHFRGENSKVAWIESGTESNQRNLWNWIKLLLKELVNLLPRTKSIELEPKTREYNFFAKHPLRNHKFRVHIVALTEELPQ